MGNTVLVVEHDEDAIREADHVVDMGPGAGVHGGEIIAEGTPDADHGQPEQPHRPISHRRRSRSPCPKQRRKPTKDRWLKVVGARGNNLKNVTAEIPLGTVHLQSPACRAAANRPSLIETLYKRGGAQAERRARASPARMTASRAWNSSTR